MANGADDKKTECIKVWMSEKLFIDLNRAAILDDRKLSEFIGLILERYAYGNARRVDRDEEGPNRPDAGRSGPE
jgi:hypothetical protein